MLVLDERVMLWAELLVLQLKVLQKVSEGLDGRGSLLDQGLY